MKTNTIVLALIVVTAINALNLAHLGDSIPLVIEVDEAALVNGQQTRINQCFSDTVPDRVTEFDWFADHLVIKGCGQVITCPYTITKGKSTANFQSTGVCTPTPTACPKQDLPSYAADLKKATTIQSIAGTIYLKDSDDNVLLEVDPKDRPDK